MQIVRQRSRDNPLSRTLNNFISKRNMEVATHGMLLCYYLIALLTTFVMGFVNLIMIRYSDEPEHLTIKMNAFTFTFPVAASLLDVSTRRLWHVNEKNYYSFLKVAVIIYYLGLYVMSLQNREQPLRFYVISSVNFILVPPLHIIYGYMLRCGKLQ